MRFWLAVSWLTWPLYLMGWCKPYGIASGKYAAHLIKDYMKNQEPLGPEFDAVFFDNVEELYEK